MRRPRTIQRHPDLFASEDPPPTLKVPERSNLLALVSLLLKETTKVRMDLVEDDHEDHI
tara:strand:+ start:485 stop:661 length:177 start_codon:yes stop_codon:yes gene_type:complete